MEATHQVIAQVSQEQIGPLTTLLVSLGCAFSSVPIHETQPAKARVPTRQTPKTATAPVNRPQLSQIVLRAGRANGGAKRENLMRLAGKYGYSEKSVQPIIGRLIEEKQLKRLEPGVYKTLKAA